MNQVSRPSSNSALSLSATVVRWLARAVSIMILLFWGFFLIAHLIGDEERLSRPLSTGEYISLAAMVLSLLGLAVAWKWELAGGATTLVAVLIGALVNWRILTFPGTLIPIAAIMFLACWWMNRSHRA